MGIKGNDRADSLASRAPEVEGRAMKHADILNAVRIICQNEFLGGELDFTSVT